MTESVKHKEIGDELKLKFTNLFLEVTKELQRVKIWTDETPDEKTGKKQWDNLFEQTLKELYVLYGFFVEYEPNDKEVKYFIEGNFLNKANPDFIPPYIPFFESTNKKISNSLYNALNKAETKFSSEIKSPKVYQHLPVQPKTRNSFKDFELISDKCLNCHVPCEIRSNNDYYVVLFDEVAFFQFAYNVLNRTEIFPHYLGQEKSFLKYLLKFAIGIEAKLSQNILLNHLKLNSTDQRSWKTKQEFSIRKKIDEIVEENYKNENWLNKINSILIQLVHDFIKTTKTFPIFKRESTITDLEILKHVSRFDIDASFEIKDQHEKLILHDVFVFPIYTQKTEKVFTIKCVQDEELDVHSPILLVLYIKTRKYIDGELDEDESSVDGFQLTKEITKLFAEKIIQEDYLKNIIRKETRHQAVRAAISQVMARNMSHNIGSHVLNNLTDGTFLSNISNYECCSYQPGSEFKDLKEDSKIIHQLAIYNNYVKCRMDYLSDITFGTPVMHTNKKIYAELYKEFDKVRLLLDHISGLSKNFQFKITFTLSDNPITADNDFLIALPNDLLGCQAFYNIIENVIRNTAKHNQKKSATTTFTVNFKEITDDLKKVADKELWYEVEIYDDVKISKINNLVNAQNNKLNQSVLNEKTNQLRNSSLGLLEMEASAAYLRKLDITTIEEDAFHVEDNKKISNKQGKLNILKAFNKNGALGYRFFVSKPTEFLFVGDFDLIENQKKELSKKGIWVRTNEDFTNEVKAGVVFNHQFLLSTSYGIENFRTSLPVRIILIEKNSPIVELLKVGSFENIEHWVWQEWFNKNKGGFECINIMTSYDDEVYNQPNRYNIAISHHDTTIESCKKDFEDKNIDAFDVLSSNALNKLPNINGKDLVDYIDQLKNDTVFNHINKFKLFEAYSNTVAVIDERIQRYSNEKYLELENKEIFSFTNVILPNDIELASDNYTKAIVKKIEAFAEKAIEESKCKFLVVHYSILERMYGSRDGRIDETLIKWSEKTRVIITSGRGKPPELPSKNVCYVNLSPILNAFTQVRSKYTINYLLNTARK